MACCSGVEAAIARPDRFILSVSLRDRDDHEHDIVSAMVERRVMALLLVPTTDDQRHLSAVTAAGTPVVCLDRPAHGADVDAVVADDVGGAERGVRLLLDRGHRRIAFLATRSIYTTGERLIGYRKALAAAGLPVDDAARRRRHPAADQVEPVIRRMLALDEPPTAMFSSNVAVSIGVLSGLRALRWAPAIVAFSDFDAARIADPMVTVVHNDPVELGRRGRRACPRALERLQRSAALGASGHAAAPPREPPVGASMRPFAATAAAERVRPLLPRRRRASPRSAGCQPATRRSSDPRNGSARPWPDGARDGVGITDLGNGRVLPDLVAADPDGWLGPDHVARWGASPALLVKLLDAGQRLPVHAHPTAPSPPATSTARSARAKRGR